MIKKTPIIELDNRMKRFKMLMDNIHPEWEFTVIFSKINLYYFTGTMQDGILIIKRDYESIFWVRRSYERALDESLFRLIKPMGSFKMQSEFWISFQESCIWKLKLYHWLCINVFINISHLRILNQLIKF